MSDRGVVRKCGASRNTFYRWRARLAALEVSNLRGLKVLGEEKLRPKNDGGWPGPGDRRAEVAAVETVVMGEQEWEAAAHLQATHFLSERRNCESVGLHRSVAQYEGRRSDPQQLIERLRESAAQGLRLCYWRPHILMVRRKRWK